MEISCKIVGIENLITNIERLAEAKQAAVNALNDTASHVRQKAITETENAKAVAFGRLRESWQIEKATTQKMVAKVGTSLARNDFQDKKYFPYAEVVESGAKPHFPPTQALAAWVQKKGLAGQGRSAEQIAYMIARKISRDGIQGRNIFKKATADTQKFLDTRMAEVMSGVEAKWGT